jgi:DNA ligase-1
MIGMKAHNGDLNYLEGYIGWYASRKLNGYAALWDGGVTRGVCAKKISWYNEGGDWRKKHQVISTGLWTLDGKVIMAPDKFLDRLPLKVPLHGELWCDDNKSVVAVSRSHNVTDSRWNNITFMVYNIKPYELWPFSSNMGYNLPWLQRMEHAKGISGGEWGSFKYLEQNKVTSVKELTGFIEESKRRNWEGIMLINPYSYYECKRSHNLVKFKPTYDYEGIVLGYNAGTGKHLGRMGSLEVKVTWDDNVLSMHGGTADMVGKTVYFKVGGGFSDEQREWSYVSSMWPVGKEITFNFQEIGVNGCPPTAICAEI